MQNMKFDTMMAILRGLSLSGRAKNPGFMDSVRHNFRIVVFRLAEHEVTDTTTKSTSTTPSTEQREPTDVPVSESKSTPWLDCGYKDVTFQVSVYGQRTHARPLSP